MQTTITLTDLVIASAIGQLAAITVYGVAKAVIGIWTLIQDFRNYKLEMEWKKKG